MLGRLFRWIGDSRKAGRLRRLARRTADANQRAELLLDAAKLDDLPSCRMEAAVALAEAGRYDESAASWRRAIQMKPVLIPEEPQVAALEPVLPQIAREVLDGLSRQPSSLKHRWKLARRGAFEGEERWRLEQETKETMHELLPTLRFIALAVAHTAAAPGRLRIDCDRVNPDSDAFHELLQMGEAVFTWDADRRITSVNVHE